MAGERSELKHQMRIYGPVALLVVIAFVLAYQFIKPAPPGRIVMATAAPDGAYHAFARRYAAYLAQEGITLELRTTAGSVENIALLRAGEVDLALVQGGVDAPAAPASKAPADAQAAAPGLTSLGSVYYEPLWLFHRRDVAMQRVVDLAGRRIAVGPEGSGTRALVARLLRDNGVTEVGNWLPQGGRAAVDALIGGEADAAFLVISAESPLIAELLRHPDIRLADFRRAKAYSRRYRFLSTLELPEGSVDLEANIPEATVHLLAPTANLVSRPDLHPALVDLILIAAREVHRDGGWFEHPDEFPMPEHLAFPLNRDADRFYEHGPPFLQRVLPFWAASLIDRLKIMLLPLLVLLLPLFKVMPPIYQWRMRARIYRWYDELERVELRAAAGDVDKAWLGAELDRIEAEVQRVDVPLSFTDRLYHLRQHIELVRREWLHAASPDAGRPQ